MSVHLIANSIWQNPGNRGRRLRKGFAAVAWQWHKRASGSVRSLRLVNGMRFNAYPDCVVSSSLIYADWPEHDELMLLRRSLMPSNIVIDVGANVGHVSLLLADLVGARNIVAFEPAPRAFGRLTENWILNNFPTDKLFNMAVGASPGAVFIENDEHPTTTLQVSEDPAGARSVRVPLVRLDDYRHEWKGHAVGVLKIDVEGYEPAVFEGASLRFSPHTDMRCFSLTKAVCMTFPAALHRICSPFRQKSWRAPAARYEASAGRFTAFSADERG